MDLARAVEAAGRRKIGDRPNSPPEFEAGLPELAEILSGRPPQGLPDGPRKLAVRLREDDEFAREIWSHPMYLALVEWARDHYPRDHQAWEDMAAYALSRVQLFHANAISEVTIRAGMLGTACWVNYRGRELERLDRPEPSIESIDLVAESHFPSVAEPEPPRPTTPVDYLTVALGGELPDQAREILEAGWRVAHVHYVWLARITGLRGDALLAAGQNNEEVNHRRRLGCRLPKAWPLATRKAVVHLLAGSPRNEGLLALWSSTPAEEVPLAVLSRWRGLVTVIDPEVGGLAERHRRTVRERAQRWEPSIPAPVCEPSIAI